MVSKPDNYWQLASDGRVSSSGFDYGYSKPNETSVIEPINAVTYGSSYANSSIIGAGYGLWNNSVKLDNRNFYDTVMGDSKNVWLVAFMNPKCPKCQKFVYQWDLVKNYDYIKDRPIKFGFVDITKEDNYREVALKYTPYAYKSQQMTTPTLIIYGRDKRHPEEYTGEQTAYSLGDYLSYFSDYNGYGVYEKSSFLFGDQYDYYESASQPVPI